ncbi:MAG: hypothetical protein ACTSPV_19350 [Candidatus Hodarchaeales archaeon]
MWEVFPGIADQPVIYAPPRFTCPDSSRPADPHGRSRFHRFVRRSIGRLPSRKHAGSTSPVPCRGTSVPGG